MLLELIAIDIALAITASIRLVLPAFKRAERKLKKKFSVSHKVGHLLVFNVGSLVLFPFIAYLMLSNGKEAIEGYSDAIIKEHKE